MILGIRPEDLQIAQPARVDSGGMIPATVELVELLGEEALVHLTSAGIELTARLPVPLPVIDGVLPLVIPADRVHLFDGDSGDRLDA